MLRDDDNNYGDRKLVFGVLTEPVTMRPYKALFIQSLLWKWSYFILIHRGSLSDVYSDCTKTSSIIGDWWTTSSDPVYKTLSFWKFDLLIDKARKEH